VAQSKTSGAQATGMEAESDGALLYYISCRETAADRALSDAATREFYRRHAASLLRSCRRICSHFGSFVDAEDLFQATIARAVQRAETFREGDDPSRERRRTLSWLSSIARNLLVDALRNPKRGGPITGEQEKIAVEDYSSEDFASLYCDGKVVPRDIQTLRLIREGFETLDERTRLVLMHTVLQRQRSPKGSYMYRGSVQALAKELGVSPVNIRRIRRLGVKALSDYVSARIPQA